MSGAGDACSQSSAGHGGSLLCVLAPVFGVTLAYRCSATTELLHYVVCLARDQHIDFFAAVATCGVTCSWCWRHNPVCQHQDVFVESMMQTSSNNAAARTFQFWKSRFQLPSRGSQGGWKAGTMPDLIELWLWQRYRRTDPNRCLTCACNSAFNAAA